jgi:hypothetical protein
MAFPATTIRIPRARMYIEEAAGSNRFVDAGRLEDTTLTIEGDPTIISEFDPTNCIKYESSRTYITPTVTLSAQVASVDVAAMARALQSESQTVASGATTYTTGTGLTAGDLIDLGCLPAGSRSTGAFVPGAWTAVDSTGSPVAFVEGSDWEWYDPASGIIKILDVAGMTQPFIFSGSRRATTRAVLADDMGATLRVVIAAVDQQSSCTGEKIELWKAMVSSGNEVTLSQALSSDEPGTLTLAMEALPDTTRAGTSTLGQFGYWERG